MNIKKTIIGLLTISLVLLITPIGQTMANEGIGYEENNKLVTLTVDDLTIMVNAGGIVPKFHYKLDGGLSFNIMFKLLAEFKDFNDDGVLQYNETNIWGTEPPTPGEIRHSTILALTSVMWAFSGFETEESEGTVIAVHFNFTSTTITDPFYSGLELAIYAHLYLEDQTINGYELEGSRELKFDLMVKNWPWQKDDTKLAIRFDISSDNEEDEFEQEPGKPIDVGGNTTGAEQKAIHTEGIKERITINHKGIEGFVGYADKSQNRIGGTYEEMDVEASYGTEEDNIQYYICFEHFDDILIYDPSIGSSGESTFNFPVYTFTIIGGLFFTAAIVLLIRKRK